jgi:hypothetical protein
MSININDLLGIKPIRYRTLRVPVTFELPVAYLSPEGRARLGEFAREGVVHCHGSIESVESMPHDLQEMLHSIKMYDVDDRTIAADMLEESGHGDWAKWLRKEPDPPQYNILGRDGHELLVPVLPERRVADFLEPQTYSSPSRFRSEVLQLGPFDLLPEHVNACYPGFKYDPRDRLVHCLLNSQPDQSYFYLAETRHGATRAMLNMAKRLPGERWHQDGNDSMRIRHPYRGPGARLRFIVLSDRAFIGCQFIGGIAESRAVSRPGCRRALHEHSDWHETL